MFRLNKVFLHRSVLHLATLLLVAGAVCMAPVAAWAAHAYAQFGDIRYPADFQHFNWVNPDAPKGGQITLVAPTVASQYDKYNPFTLRGTAPPGLGDLVFESLLTGSLDEPTTAYGLLADDVRLAPDRLSVIFHLNPQARFQDASPVLAEDVAYSYKRLVSKEASPIWANMLSDVRAVQVLGTRTVRFDFRHANAALPLVVGGLPVFSHKWGAGKKFDDVIMDKPIASGPYLIGQENFGRDITYVRDSHYWAADLPVRRGMFNFDRVSFRIYKDDVAQTEAFKAGEFDYIQVFVSRKWAREFVGRKFDDGEIIKRQLPSRNSGDFQGFILNTRRSQLANPKVREALQSILDFEWMNRMLFYNAYTRVQGYFPGGDFQAKGMPGEDELALLKPLRSKLPAAVFTQPVPLAPSTKPPRSLRDNLRHARDLLAQAGWHYRDGALRNAAGQPFTLEFLDAQSQGASFARVMTPLFKNLEKLGIRTDYRVVDAALWKQRVDQFDFDVMTVRLLGSEAPGNELRDYFSSEAAAMPGSSNLAGIHDPAVDALIDKVLRATTRAQLVASLRALDRVLRFGYYNIPQWYASGFRVAWHSHKFGQPSVMPDYYQPENWVISTWWSQPRKEN